MLQRTINIQQIRSHLYRLVREFLNQEGFYEVETPCLSRKIISESSIQVFSTLYSSHQGEWPLHLLPSPEYYMKQLLAQGSGNIFQISRCFRNAEVLTDQHLLEFSLLEWYAVGDNYLDNLGRQERLLMHILQDPELHSLLTRLGSSQQDITDRCRQLASPVQRITLQEAFEHWVGIDLEAAIKAGRFPSSTASSLLDDSMASFSDHFHRLLCDRIEPQLPQSCPVALIDYPAAIPTTAKVRGHWSERWELYLLGMETANCYTEADAQQTARTGQQEYAELCRQQRGEQADQHYSQRIAGLPPCSGNALGLDRLLMALAGEKSIKGVIFFPPHDTLRE